MDTSCGTPTPAALEVREIEFRVDVGRFLGIFDDLLGLYRAFSQKCIY